MDDEYNIFSKVIGYNISFGNFIIFKDGIENGFFNGYLGLEKYYCMIRKVDGVKLEDFCLYYKENFVLVLVKMVYVLKL